MDIVSKKLETAIIDYLDRMLEFEERKVIALEKMANFKNNRGKSKISIKKKQYKIDALKVMRKQRKAGKTFEAIAQWLEKNDYKTFTGRGSWHAQTVHRLLEDNWETM